MFLAAIGSPSIGTRDRTIRFQCWGGRAQAEVREVYRTVPEVRDPSGCTVSPPDQEDLDFEVLDFHWESADDAVYLDWSTVAIGRMGDRARQKLADVCLQNMPM